jgi:hypothetical protein
MDSFHQPKKNKEGGNHTHAGKGGRRGSPPPSSTRQNFSHNIIRRLHMKKVCVITLITLLVLGFCPITSHAGDVKGKYTYTEKGYTGTMIIKWMKGQEGRAYAFTFKTTSKSNGQSCEFEATEMPSRIKDDQPAAGESDSGAKFKISFSGDTATVNVLEKGDECGMSGYFGGKYVKAKK